MARERPFASCVVVWRNAGGGREFLLTAPGTGPSEDVARFVAEAPSESRIVLDDEHDRFAWLPLAEVVARCRPASVGVGVTNAAGWLDARSSA